MLIKVGFDMTFDCPQPTPMVLMLTTHFSRAADLVQPDQITVTPPLDIRPYRDSFGNWCGRIVAPRGLCRIQGSALVRDSGLPDIQAPMARQHLVQDLPDETLVYLLGSRYCETDLLSDFAWRTFGHGPLGWARVQAVCDYVHHHIKFGYEFARPTKTANEAFLEGRGVCRDYAHLAVTLVRCLNIPARYCTGYLGDIGTPPPYGPMDFAGWFEAYLDGGWYTFDARNNTPRIGRVLIARGRDAADVPLTNSFGANTLVSFLVAVDEVPDTVAYTPQGPQSVIAPGWQA